MRPDGSWPIDTNLSDLGDDASRSMRWRRRATWTVSIEAMQLRDWLLRQQYKERHPYTGADPGGWAWTHLPGGVPDADDTPGALLALRIFRNSRQSACDHEISLRVAPSIGLAWL